MAIISTARHQAKEKIKAQISSEILAKMDAYCIWAGIDMDFFIEEAALYVFAKDKEWKQHQKTLKRSAKQAEA